MECVQQISRGYPIKIQVRITLQFKTTRITSYQATGIITSKKSETIRPLAHATSSDCFAVRAHKLAAAIIDENVNNQLVQDPGKIIDITK